MSQRIGFLISHPIQYYAPIFRELAKRCDLTVFFAHRQDATQQASAGFGVAFEWDVDLLSGYESRFLANVSRQPSTERFGGCNTPEIADVIGSGNFDAFVVPGWSLRSYWQAVRACRRARVPVMVRGDSQLVNQPNDIRRPAKFLLYPTLLRQFDGCLYVGQRNREYLQHYGTKPERLFFSPHCVDNEAFASGSEKARRESGANGTDRTRRVLYVGRLVEGKQLMDLVEAAVRLATAGKGIELVIAGSGPLEGSLVEATRAGGVDARFLGFVNQSKLPSVYAASDVIVLPSMRETWGLVINEAMACGVPAVVSDAVGCGPDLIEPGVTGAIHPAADVAALAAAIDSVLAFDMRTTRPRLAELMQKYSPVRAAEGVVEAAGALAARNRIK